MATFSVVVLLGPPEGVFLQGLQVRPRTRVDQLFLVRREETFGNSIVETDSGLAQGPPDTIFLAERSELR